MKGKNDKVIAHIKTRYYLRFLLKKSGCGSLGKLQMLIENKNNAWTEYSRRLYRNMSTYPIRDKSLIEQSEQLYPGSKRIFYHPLWEVLANPLLTKQQIYALFEQLSPDITQYIFNTNNETLIKTRKNIRYKSTWRVVEKGNLDALAFSLL